MTPIPRNKLLSAIILDAFDLNRCYPSLSHLEKNMRMFFAKNFSKRLAPLKGALKKVPFIGIMGYCFSLPILGFFSKYK